jgi:two-component system chemotaxis response regulator CheY
LKTLIVDDDFTSRLLLQELLKGFGPVHSAANGREAIEAVRMALCAKDPYDLICLDIMMPEMDGQKVLRHIRDLEEKSGILPSSGSRILMTTALDDLKSVSEAFFGLCDGYLTKPIERQRLMKELRELKLLPQGT